MNRKYIYKRKYGYKKNCILFLIVFFFQTYHIYSNTVEIFSDFKSKECPTDLSKAIFSPNSQYLVHSFARHNVFFYEIDTASIKFKLDFKNTETITHTEYSPDGNLFAVITYDGNPSTNCILYIFETNSYTLLYEKEIFYWHPTKEYGSLFSADSKFVILCQRNKEQISTEHYIEINMVLSDSGEVFKTFYPKALVNNLILSPDNQKLLVGYIYN